jgi:two-component system, NarL family, response regulator NreC
LRSLIEHSPCDYCVRATTDHLQAPGIGSTAVPVAVADAFPLLRAGARAVLEADHAYRVAVEVSDPATLTDALRETPVRVAVLDPAGLDVAPALALATLRAVCPGLDALALSADERPVRVREALDAGMRGYVLKRSGPEEIRRALDAIVAGHEYLQPDVGARLSSERAPDGLTEREVDVLVLVAEGLTNREIAERLHLSPRTIESHRARLRMKIQRATRAELVTYAQAHGLLALRLC